MNAKQFELIETLYESTKVSSSRIQELQLLIETEIAKTKAGLLSLYETNEEVSYLIQFDTYHLKFHRATKEQLSTITLSWFKSKTSFTKPKNITEATEILNNFKDPTNCEIGSYQEFGFFHDINKRYDRIDWIAEETYQGKFLFTIDKETFFKAITAVANFYTKDF
jgi:hypothetical protein